MTGLLNDMQLAALGLLRGPSGFCQHFDVDASLCRIYEDRPLACRIPVERYRENVEMCNRMMEYAGLETRITPDMLKGVTP